MHFCICWFIGRHFLSHGIKIRDILNIYIKKNSDSSSKYVWLSLMLYKDVQIYHPFVFEFKYAIQADILRTLDKGKYWIRITVKIHYLNQQK